MIIVIEEIDLPVVNDMYRILPIMRGASYDEDGFRKWVSKKWGVSEDWSLDALATEAKKGGWVCLKEIL